MRKLTVVLFFLLLNIFFISMTSADPINLNPDPDGEPWIANMPALTPEQEAMIEQLPELTDYSDPDLPSARTYPTEIPTSVDNSTNKYFRPIFNQTGNDCSQASSVGYTFTYEMACVRDLDAIEKDNQYPEHYTWNFLNGGTGAGAALTGGWHIIQANGIPNVTTYGGMVSPSPYIRWMSGYDKYYSGMANKIGTIYKNGVSDPDDIERMKRWLADHAGRLSIGGLANFSADMNGISADYLDYGTPHARERIITTFGAYSYDDEDENRGRHALTIVGYDDAIRYDFNNDGKYTNDIDINGDGIVDVKDWEIGAVKIANTWGKSWLDDGFSWMMYRLLAVENEQGGIHKVKENDELNSYIYYIEVEETYTPKITMKIKMTHSSRNKLRLLAGVAADPNATEPDITRMSDYLWYDQFNFTGGDLPMRGDSTDPIEIGLDVTKLYDRVGDDEAKKFFLTVIDSDDTGESTGKIISISLIDYTNGGFEYQGESNVDIPSDDSIDVMANIVARNTQPIQPSQPDLAWLVPVISLILN